MWKKRQLIHLGSYKKDPYLHFRLHGFCRKLFATLISNFRRVMNAVVSLSGNLPASELLVPTFRNLLAVLSAWALSVEVIPRIGVEGYKYRKCWLKVD